MRTIDVDALLETMEKFFIKAEDEAKYTGRRNAEVTWNDALYMIKTAPTIEPEQKVEKDGGRKMSFPMERFRIIFRHDFINSDGQALDMEEPLVVSMVTRERTPVSINYILSELMERMEHEVMQKYGGK